MDTKYLIGLFVVGALAVLGYFSLFTVHQTQQALVLQLGNPQKTITQPGLHIKLPIQDVKYFEKRIMDYDPREQEVILGDAKRLVVDTIARFKIVDPLLYYQRFSNGELQFTPRLQEIINASLRSVLGKYNLNDLLSKKRQSIMAEVEASVNQETLKSGVEIVEILIKRADLPKENTQAVLQRMQKERERIAAQFRAEGQQEAQEIRADADRQKTVILAEAERQNQILRGQGDKAAGEIFASAFSIDPQFYEFLRTMEAYKKSFQAGNSSMVISPESEFFKFFRSIESSGESKFTQNLAPEEQKVKLESIEKRLNSITGIVDQTKTDEGEKTQP